MSDSPSIKLQIKTINELIVFGEAKLLPYSDSAKLDAKILLAFILNKELSFLLTWPEQHVTEQDIHAFYTLVARREQGEPIAYIVEEREFWSLPFYVSPATLIPRPDTEILVEHVLSKHTQREASCLDLGTGTGAIALSLASERECWEFDAVDFSFEAVVLAKKNAKRLKLENVNIYQSDWFSNVDKTKRFDIIVSNPPYIDENDAHLSEGDVRFEPTSALVAADEGLADIKQIVEDAKRRLNENACLYLEHGFEQGSLVRSIMNNSGYVSVETVQDYSGNDRVTFGVYKKSKQK